jgi:hypothetical protein
VESDPHQNVKRETFSSLARYLGTEGGIVLLATLILVPVADSDSNNNTQQTSSSAYASDEDTDTTDGTETKNERKSTTSTHRNVDLSNSENKSPPASINAPITMNSNGGKPIGIYHNEGTDRSTFNDNRIENNDDKKAQIEAKLTSPDLKDKSTLEIVINHASVFVGKEWLTEAMAASRSVVCILKKFAGKLGKATGSLISSKLIMTNHHVFKTAPMCQNSVVCFNYDDGMYAALPILRS